MATIAGIWTSPGRKSGRMDGHERVRALADHGLEGCAHARPGGKRQVLFASSEHLDAVGVEPGRIRENFTVEGADVQVWPVGQRRSRRLGAVFEVTMVCDPCERMEAIRPGPPRESSRAGGGCSRACARAARSRSATRFELL